MSSNNSVAGAPPLKAWLLLLLLALIWGSSFMLIKIGLTELYPTQLAALRIASAGFVLLPFLLHRFKTVRPHHWLKLVSVGFVGSFIPAILFATAQTKLPSGVTGVLNTFTPLATLLIGIILFQQKFVARQLIGLLIGLVGTLILITATGNDQLEFNAFALLVIGATICYGMNLNLIKHRIPDLGALTITGVSLFLVAPPALLYLLLGTPFVAQLNSGSEAFLHAVGAVLVLGTIGTAMALVLFNTVVKMADTTFTSSVTYIIPIVALMLGVLDGEPFLLGHGVGLVAILAGVFISNRRRRSS